MVDIPKLIRNKFVMGLAYLHTFFDFLALLELHQEGILYSFLLYGVLVTKLGCFFIAGKVDFSQKNINARNLVTPFLFFMMIIGYLYTTIPSFSTFVYNIIVIFSIPWFFYYSYKDDKLEKENEHY
jgi:hypothetical protein